MLDKIFSDNNFFKKKTILIAAIIIILVLLAVTTNFLFYGEQGGFGMLANWADPTKYQAVFLTNGQVYFGRITNVNSQTLILEDIYYLRAAGNLQAGSDANAATSSAAKLDLNSLSLVKLGSEVHGPDDRMSINLSQVLFTEDLKADSRVVAAITQYESNK